MRENSLVPSPPPSLLRAPPRFVVCVTVHLALSEPSEPACRCPFS